MSAIYPTCGRIRTPRVLSRTIIRLAAVFGLFLSAAVVCSVKASTIHVNGLGDSLANDGVCTLREAIINANSNAATRPDCEAGSGTDIISLPVGTITLNIPNVPSQFTTEDLCLTGDLDIGDSLVINGHPDGTTINANALDRIFDIGPDSDGNPMTPPPTIVVQLNKLTITNGFQNDVGGVRVNQNATVTIDDSTISGNRSWANDAGGVGNLGKLTMRNCTISGNTCLLVAGGIKNEGTLELLSCTVTRNDSDFDNLNGGVWNLSPGTTTLRNTIIAGNFGTNLPNVQGDFISGGYNIIGDFGANPPIAPNIADQLDVIDATVQLGLLASNGGPTMTHALGPISIAIDQGNAFGLTTDQRGFTRPCDQAGVVNAPGGHGADVGAFEVQGPCVTNTAPVAVNDVYNINQDTPLHPAAPGVLGNDTDADGDALTAHLVSGPSHATTFVLNANGSFTYIPVAHFTGVDSFTYKANDGTDDSAVATVTINIADTEPPTITAAVGVNTLWPPNHSLINVGLTVSVTDNSAGPINTEIKVFSNEDDIFQGSGNASPDARDIAPGTLRLRSERSGPGSGRIYLIRIVSNDPSNNVSHECLTVVVPKNQSASDIAFINAAAAVARAFCETTGNPPAGYFVVGDGPIINPPAGKVHGRVSVAGGVTNSPDPLAEPIAPQLVTDNRVILVPGLLTVIDEKVSVKEYEEFQRVLLHLQTDALPQNNMATIRGKARELLELGEAVIKLDVPTGTKADKVEAFKNQLANFRKALDKYGVSAESGVDADLKTSFSTLHDSFAELAGMLPGK
jgi:CSLREA domain-containing protein